MDARKKRIDDKPPYEYSFSNWQKIVFANPEIYKGERYDNDLYVRESETKYGGICKCS